MNTKSANKITVTDICKAADINRCTFYIHFENVNDLANQTDEYIYNEIVQHIGAQNADSLKEMLTGIFTAIKSNSKLCRIYITQNSNSSIIERLLDYAFNYFQEFWKSSFNKAGVKALNYIYSYNSGGTIGIIKKWINSGFKESPEEMAKITVSLIERGNESFKI